MGSKLDLFIAVGSIWSLTALGCILAYIYCDHKGVKSSEEFLQKMLPARSPEFYFRTDFCMSCVLGTVVGVIAYAPANAVQALGAGIGWTAAFGVLKAKAPDRDHAQKAAERPHKAVVEGGETKQ